MYKCAHTHTHTHTLSLSELHVNVLWGSVVLAERHNLVSSESQESTEDTSCWKRSSSTFSVHIYNKQSNHRMCWCSDIQNGAHYHPHFNLLLLSSLPCFFLIVHFLPFIRQCSESSLWCVTVCLTFSPPVLVSRCKQTTSGSRLWSGLFQHLRRESLISEWRQPAAISDGILKQFHLNRYDWA